MRKRRERLFSATRGPQGESDLALDAWPFSLSFSQCLLEQRGSGHSCACRMGRGGPSGRAEAASEAPGHMGRASRKA